MSKRVPIYLSVEQMKIIVKALGNGKKELTVQEEFLIELLDEEIYRNEEQE